MNGILSYSPVDRIKCFFKNNPETVINLFAATAIGAFNLSPGVAIGLFVSQELSSRLSIPCLNRAVDKIWAKFFPPKSTRTQAPSIAHESSIIVAHSHSSKMDVVLFCGINTIAIGLASIADVFKRCKYVDTTTYIYGIFPYSERTEKCEWDHRNIAIYTGIFVLQGVTLLFYRAKFAALRRDFGQHRAETEVLAARVTFNTATISSHTVAIHSLTRGLSITNRRVDSQEEAIRALKQQFKEIIDRLDGKISALFEQLFSNVGIQTILDNPAIILELARTQQEKAQALKEQTFIKQRPHLKKYYHELSQCLNGGYMACLVIKSGFVGPNPVQNLDDYLRIALGALPFPGIGIITSILGAVQGSRKISMVNRLCSSFGSDLLRDLEHLEQLARYLTIKLKKVIFYLPPLDHVRAVFHAAKDAILDDNGVDPVINQARKNCETFFQKVLSGKLDINTVDWSLLAQQSLGTI